MLKNMPDGCIDLVVTDPPYEFNCGKGGGAFGSDKRRYHEEYLSIKDERGYADYETQGARLNYCSEQRRKQIKNLTSGFDFSILDECCRVMKKINIYVWCSKAQVNKLLNYFEQKKCNIDILTWHKTNVIPTCHNTYLNDTEYLIFAREKGVKVYGSYATKHKYYVTKANVEDKKKWIHPTIKPLPIIENLIINSSNECDTVLDCFMGSGTTGVACKHLNRNFIGIEIDEKYYEIARKRIEECE